jgi:hypothetical protein
MNSRRFKFHHVDQDDFIYQAITIKRNEEDVVVVAWIENLEIRCGIYDVCDVEELIEDKIWIVK